jgi:hypothetical protein
MKSVDLSDRYNPTDNSKISTMTHEYPIQDPNVSPISATPAGSMFSSIISSPLTGRISFQTLTNFIPIPWSPRTPLAESATSSLATTSSSSSSVSDEIPSSSRTQFWSSAVIPQKRGYVSKEKQLEKLRSRLDVVKISAAVDVRCERCDGQAVSL